jgi:tetratricopeptide (TPR) repeat protein
MRDAKRFVEGETLFPVLEKTWKELIRSYPEIPEYRDMLGLAYMNLAAIYVDTGRSPERAYQLLDQAVAYGRDAVERSGKHHVDRLEHLAWSYQYLAMALVQLGDYSGADMVLAQLTALNLSPGEALYLAAGAMARSVSTVEVAPGLSEAQRRSLVESYRTRALGLLREAIDQGLAVPADIEEDEEFDPIRSLPAYRRLINGLRGSSPKSAKTPVKE